MIKANKKKPTLSSFEKMSQLDTVAISMRINYKAPHKNQCFADAQQTAYALLIGRIRESDRYLDYQMAGFKESMNLFVDLKIIDQEFWKKKRVVNVRGRMTGHPVLKTAVYGLDITMTRKSTKRRIIKKQ